MEEGQPILRGPEDRDPQNHNAFVKVAYSDVICEPSAVQSPQCSHQFTKIIFDNTVSGTYWVLTIVFGGLLSFLYGLSCGVLSFVMVWVATPFSRAWLIPLGLVGKIWLFIVRCFYDPLYESCGRIFSNVNININRATIHNV
ncbi:Caveolin-1 [Desmophyllum pertusum]|uniref:Caveolin n=1 Tax=Desmophyllum pertusum TaxID=174260 RepID=A0A9X0DAQ7_9CNID|nr:Caveolin-1 [Desmophyllum pertusum]